MNDIGCKYKVSVSIITYNQAGYIQQAVDSALAQEVDFPCEIIIGDDGSTDGTRDILRDYKQRHPNIITLHLHDKHDTKGIAGRKNNITNIESAQGQYISFLDGDDYWMSRDKLQKQANFMDGHPEYSLCTCDALNIYEESNKQFLESGKPLYPKKSSDFNYRTVVKREAPIIASSAFFRRESITPLPRWFNDVYRADRFLQLIALQHGSGRYLHELKICKIWTNQSIYDMFMKNRTRIKVNRNDEAIVNANFPSKQTRPYSYKAQFYMASVFRYKKQHEIMKMIRSMYKVYSYDATLIAHWLKIAIEKNNNAFKTVVFKLLCWLLEKDSS